MKPAKDSMSAMKHRPAPAGQRGLSLPIALIALALMTLAGIALIRAVDIANVIAGNLAFRQSALHATDVGVETAVNALSTITGAALEANYPGGCAAGACNYYPTMQATDAKGVPAIIDWGQVPSVTINDGYSVQYVIDRLCQGPAPVTDIAGKCYADAATGGGTQKAGGIVFSGTQAVYYRVTVRVGGPRNTTSIAQAILAR